MNKHLASITISLLISVVNFGYLHGCQAGEGESEGEDRISSSLENPRAIPELVRVLKLELYVDLIVDSLVKHNLDEARVGLEDAIQVVRKPYAIAAIAQGLRKYNKKESVRAILLSIKRNGEDVDLRKASAAESIDYARAALISAVAHLMGALEIKWKDEGSLRDCLDWWRKNRANVLKQFPTNDSTNIVVPVEVQPPVKDEKESER